MNDMVCRDMPTLYEVYKMGFIDGAIAMLSYIKGKTSGVVQGGNKKEAHMKTKLLRILRRQSKKLVRLRISDKNRYELFSSCCFNRAFFMNGCVYYLSADNLHPRPDKEWDKLVRVVLSDCQCEQDAIDKLNEVRRLAILGFVKREKRLIANEKINNRLEKL